MLITLLANTQGLTITLLFKNPMMHAGHQRGRKRGRIQVIRNYFVHTCLRVGNYAPGEPRITGSPIIGLTRIFTYSILYTLCRAATPLV
jgi:hypothetical protein